MRRIVLHVPRWLESSQILHNQVQRSESTQPWVLLNAVNVKDGAAYSLTTDWTVGRAERWTVAADGSNVSVSGRRNCGQIAGPAVKGLAKKHQMLSIAAKSVNLPLHAVSKLLTTSASTSLASAGRSAWFSSTEYSCEVEVQKIAVFCMKFEECDLAFKDSSGFPGNQVLVCYMNCFKNSIAA